MSKHDDPRAAVPAVPELPEDIRGVIQREVESGLAHLRAGEFEVKLRAAMQANARCGGRESARGMRAGRTRKPALIRWAPVYGVALLAGIIGIVVLPSRRSPAPDPKILASILETLPGIQSLNLAPLDLSRIPVEAPAVSPLLGPLAAAASARAEADAAIPAPSIPVLSPRYTLEQKIEILTKERPIERALALIKSTSGEV
jgi:hypothetical protein